MRRERNLRVLHAQGVPAVVTRPQTFERTVFDAYSSFKRRRQV